MAEQEPLGLFELNRQIRLRIQSGFPDPIWVVGEISDFSENRNGHCYLELVEKEKEGDRIIARIRATIWATAYRMLRPFFESATGQSLMPGLRILVRADVEFHELYSISLNIRDIEPSFTIGDLERRRRDIIIKLQESGVFEMNRELQLALVPQKIAVISSPTAAGYGDFSDQLLRNPYGYVFYAKLFPAVMQGEETPSSVIEALDRIAAHAGFFDAVVIIRGGGSKLDLSSFDHYELGLNVAQFPLPVITGIGHEQDDSIVDLVAHTRCKTPTAVAEFLIGCVSDFENEIDEAAETATDAAVLILNGEKMRMARILEGMKLRISGYASVRTLRLNTIAERMTASSRMHLARSLERLERYEQVAALHDPANILKRGYSITMKDGRAVTSPDQTVTGDILETRLAGGTIESIRK